MVAPPLSVHSRMLLILTKTPPLITTLAAPTPLNTTINRGTPRVLQHRTIDITPVLMKRTVTHLADRLPQTNEQAAHGLTLLDILATLLTGWGLLKRREREYLIISGGCFGTLFLLRKMVKLHQYLHYEKGNYLAKMDYGHHSRRNYRRHCAG